MATSRSFIPFMLVLISILFILFGPTAQAEDSTVAIGETTTTECNREGMFLTLPPWWRGLAQKTVTANKEVRCEVVSPSQLDTANNGNGFTKFIWTIVLNLIEILLQIVGYASVGFIIFGGFKYLYSAGSPNGMQAARKTITNAVIGLIISLFAVGIVNAVAGALSK